MVELCWMTVYAIHPIRHSINIYVSNVERRCGVVNCLTIDFDIIMKPSINFYNDLVNEEWSVSGIEKEYPMVAAVLPPDFGIY